MRDERGARRLYLVDSRLGGRHMRVTWHPESASIVFSHWVGDCCVASTPIAAQEVSPLIALLTDALLDSDPQRDLDPPSELDPAWELDPPWEAPRSDSA
jgi:hypothetical protein